MFSPVSFSPLQLWINQAPPGISHVPSLRGHAHCNGKPSKALPFGEDTPGLIQALQEASDGLILRTLSLASGWARVPVGFTPPCTEQPDSSAPDKSASAIIRFVLSRVTVSVLPSELEAAERKMNVGA